MPAASRAQPWQRSNRSDSAGGSEGGTEFAESPEVSSGRAGADLIGSGTEIAPEAAISSGRAGADLVGSGVPIAFGTPFGAAMRARGGALNGGGSSYNDDDDDHGDDHDHDDETNQ